MRWLTSREAEILCLAAYTNQETANLLGIQHQTVKNHWSRIYDKFFGSNRGRRGLRIKAVIFGLVTREIWPGDVMPGPVRRGKEPWWSGRY